MLWPYPKLIEAGPNHQVACFCAQNNRDEPAIASPLGNAPPVVLKAAQAKRLEDFAFSLARRLARFVQETDRSVSSSQGEKQ
jgi:hypothetical protein